MKKFKLIRITTVPISLEKLLEGQLQFMKDYFEVTAISSEKEQLEKFGKKEGVSTFYIPLTRKITPLKDLLAVWKLYKFLIKDKPQIVHSHTPKAGIVSMLAAYLAKVPNRLHTVAGLPLLETKGLKRKILNSVEKLTYRFATKVYPNSQGLYQITIDEKFTKPSKLKLIGNGSSNGIDTAYFSPKHFTNEDLKEKRKELQIPGSDFVFVFVGRLVGDKGINELIKAFEKLQNEFQNCSLLLVGPFEDDLDPLLIKTKISIKKKEKIILTGYQEDVRIYYAMSDVFVFPSYREGFPNVVMQAGAMDLPSIVTDINGCNEIINDGENGWIIPVKDEMSLFNAMQNCLLNKQQVLKLAQNARELITTRYAQQKVWDAILEEYKRLEIELNLK